MGGRICFCFRRTKTAARANGRDSLECRPSIHDAFNYRYTCYTACSDSFVYCSAGAATIVRLGSHRCCPCPVCPWFVSKPARFLPILRLHTALESAAPQGERMPRLVRLGGTVMPRARANAVYLTFKVGGLGCGGGDGGTDGGHAFGGVGASRACDDHVSTFVNQNRRRFQRICALWKAYSSRDASAV